MKKYWAILGIGLLLVIAVWWYLASNGEENGREIYVVQRQDLTEVISEVGKVVPVKEIDLTFPLTGRISEITVNEGQTVSKGDVLAKLDSAKTRADLANAQASVQEAQARLDKIYSGASSYEIQVAETAVANAENNLRTVELASESNIKQAETNIVSAQIALTTAQQYLLDQQNKTDEDLLQSYEEGLDTLNSGFTKMDTAIRQIERTRELYFDTNANTHDIEVKSEEKRVKNEFDQLTPMVEAADINDFETIDTAVDEMMVVQRKLADTLALIREKMDVKVGINITDADKTLVDNERASIDRAIVELTLASQGISSAKLNNEISLNTAEADVEQAQSALNEADANLDSVKYDWESRVAQARGELNLARDELALKKSPPRDEDIALYKAQVNQAVAYVDLIQQNLLDTEMKAPMNGLVTDIYSEVGELADLARPVMAMIAEDQYQVESFISELDIAGVMINDPVDMDFDAFGKDVIFTGRIIGVNPYETIIDGDIYYKVTIDFDEYDADIRSGMTADIRINTADKDAILVIPSRYIGEEGGRKYVKIPLDNVKEGEEPYKRVEISTGLKGIDMTEVKSGLKEGDKIIPYY